LINQCGEVSQLALFSLSKVQRKLTCFDKNEMRDCIPELFFFSCTAFNPVDFQALTKKKKFISKYL
jgi:hypothetical protein